LKSSEVEELAELEQYLNERLAGTPESPKKRALDEDLAFFMNVQRPPLPTSLQDDLARRQTAVDHGSAGNSPWKEFKAHERQQARRGQPTVKKILAKMFHGKCAWPKSPHPQNARRGSPAVMFRWHNLLWACNICNGFECKASRMEWDAQGDPKLLNVLRELGPDYEAPEGYTVRQRFLEFLAPTEPYLAPVRQILYTEPSLCEELLNLLPELASIFTSWALPLDDCRELESS
jgi:hypothetical protein